MDYRGIQGLHGDIRTILLYTIGGCKDNMGIKGLQGETKTTGGYRDFKAYRDNRDIQGLQECTGT